MRFRAKTGAVIVLALCGAAVALSGCGVRGSLEAPAGVQTQTGDATPGKPGEPKPHNPSILDPLLR